MFSRTGGAAATRTLLLRLLLLLLLLLLLVVVVVVLVTGLTQSCGMASYSQAITMAAALRTVRLAAHLRVPATLAQQRRAMASASRGTVLVTGSTGRVGKEVIARLSQVENFAVRAATRDKGDYAKSLGAHEVVKFDLTDKETWAPAMDGVTHLFSRYGSWRVPRAPDHPANGYIVDGLQSTGVLGPPGGCTAALPVGNRGVALLRCLAFTAAQNPLRLPTELRM